MINKLKEKLKLSEAKETLKLLWKVLKYPVYIITVFVLYLLAMEITTLSISNYLEESAQNFKNMTAADSVLRAYTVPIMIGMLTFKGAFILHKKLHYFIFNRNRKDIVEIPVESYVTGVTIKSETDPKDLEISIEKEIAGGRLR